MGKEPLVLYTSLMLLSLLSLFYASGYNCYPQPDIDSFVEKYKSAMDSHTGEDEMLCVVMKMDSPGTYSELLEGYQATLELAICDRRSFEAAKPADGEYRYIHIKCLPLEPNAWLKIPTKASDSFIKHENNKGNEVWDTLYRDTEYGEVADWHSPWFVLTEEQAQILFDLVKQTEESGKA
jgi:hypothetical protein